MADVFDTAKYILLKQGRLSTMKLQKLCYYAQAWSLVWDDEPLFEQEFKAWANGPVCYELFSFSQGKFSIDYNEMQGDESNLNETQSETINKVLEYYGNKNAQWLSRLTHLEKPWRTARNGLPDGSSGNAIITKESMAMYYGGL